MVNLSSIYAKIDESVKERADDYVNLSKLAKIEKTDNMKKLLEEALDYYMRNHPVNSSSEVAINT